MRCVHTSCGGLRLFSILLRTVEDELEPETFPFLSLIPTRTRTHREIREIIQDAYDLYRLGALAPNGEEEDASYRGAAIHMRIAVEILFGACILGLNKDDRREFRFNDLCLAISLPTPAKSMVRARKRVDKFVVLHAIARRRVPKLVRMEKHGDLIVAADRLRRLGNTAAHGVSKNLAEEILPTQSHVYQGFSDLGTVFGAVRIR